MRLWDVETGIIQHVLESGGGYLYSVALSRSGPDGRAILAACESKSSDTIWVWELDTGRTVKVLTSAVDAVGVAGGAEGPKEKAEDEESSEKHVEGEHPKAGEDGEMNRYGKGLITWDYVNQSLPALNFVRTISITQDGSRTAAGAGGSEKLIVWDIPPGLRSRRLGLHGKMRNH